MITCHFESLVAHVDVLEDRLPVYHSTTTSLVLSSTFFFSIPQTPQMALRGLTLCGDHSITSGKLLGQVLQNERQHKYLGQTVRLTKQAVELDVELITRAAECPTCRGKADVCLIELGGAVGQRLTSADELKLHTSVLH